jgi:hypothetical protein
MVKEFASVNEKAEGLYADTLASEIVFILFSELLLMISQYSVSDSSWTLVHVMYVQLLTNVGTLITMYVVNH